MRRRLITNNRCPLCGGGGRGDSRQHIKEEFTAHVGIR